MTQAQTAAGGVGVVCALAPEARHLGRARRRGALSVLDDGSLLAISGMGLAAARTGALALVEAGAKALVSFGVAGGLDPKLARGTLVLPEQILCIDAMLPTDATWRARLAYRLDSQCPVVGGALLSSPYAVMSSDDKAELLRDHGAVAVDMESFAVAHVAEQFGLPFIAVRAIVDTANEALPRAMTAAADRNGRLQLWRLIGALAVSPSQWAPTLQLAGSFRTAGRSLSAVARVGIAATYLV